MSTLVTYIGRDAQGCTRFGEQLLGETDWNNATRLVSDKHSDGWTLLQVRDLDHGVQVGAIETQGSTRTWWAK